MQSYESLIYEKLKGSTPKEKYENLEKMIDILNRIAYPVRGSDDEIQDINYFANIIQKKLGLLN